MPKHSRPLAERLAALGSERLIDCLEWLVEWDAAPVPALAKGLLEAARADGRSRADPARARAGIRRRRQRPELPRPAARGLHSSRRVGHCPRVCSSGRSRARKAIALFAAADRYPAQERRRSSGSANPGDRDRGGSARCRAAGGRAPACAKRSATRKARRATWSARARSTADSPIDWSICSSGSPIAASRTATCKS